jgi:hypothetical protein
MFYLNLEYRFHDSCLNYVLFIKSISQLQVNISLNAAAGRLKKTREERDQFDEANNQIIFKLKTKVLFPSYF